MDLATLVLDFNGTLAEDGRLLDGVRDLLHALSSRLDIIVATADTYGTAANALGGLPVRVRVVQTGADKAEQRP